MNRREDIIKVLHGQTPEYLPWFGDLDYWITYLLEEHRMPEKYLQMDDPDDIVFRTGLTGTFHERGLQMLHRDLGVGMYLQGYFPFREVYRDMEYSQVVDPDTRTRMTVFRTPMGELRETWTFLQSSYSWAPVEHLIKSPDDLKVLQYVYEHMEYVPDYALAELRGRLIGDQGIVVVYAPKTPMMELVALKAGLETVVELYADEPELLEETLAVMGRKVDEAVEIALAAPADCIFFPENLSSEMVAGALYEQYIGPVHRRWTARAREVGRVSFVHLDGTLTPLLTNLSENGFDVVEAVTPRPVGDVPLEDLRSRVQGETILCGGIPGGFFSDQLTDEKFDEYVINAIGLMKRQGKFILGVADEVVPGATFQRIRRVSELVKLYGKQSS